MIDWIFWLVAGCGSFDDIAPKSDSIGSRRLDKTATVKSNLMPLRTCTQNYSLTCNISKAKRAKPSVTMFLICNWINTVNCL